MQMYHLLISVTYILFCAVLFEIAIIIHSYSLSDGIIFSESLTPYTLHHGSHMNHRQIRDCHKTEYGSPPHELYAAHKPMNTSTSIFKVKRFVKELFSFPKRTIRGHYIVISDPLSTLSVLEPDQVGGCNLSILQTVSTTARKANCVLALNAGYFDTKQGTCYGNVVSDGRKAQDSQGVQNAHFGLTNDGQIFTGYLSEEELNSGIFKQLVGGVVWILRNGTGFVNASQKLECGDSQETGSMDQFVNILSARSVVGHDSDGNVVIVQVDGKSGVDGINLNELEILLREFGFVNALNLDGGGSSTLVIDGVTVNYPYDTCPDGKFSCDRRVSSVLCVHPPYCEPRDCHNHGTCSNGECVCSKNWQPPTCSQLFCAQTNCSNHGVCLPEGCSCYPGFYGDNCDNVCMDGWFGTNCLKWCNCINAESCDKTSGTCKCKPGYTGGKSSRCLANSMIQEEHLVKDKEEKRKRFITIIVLGVITTVCLTSLIVVMFCSCSCRCKNEQVLCSKNDKRKFSKLPLQLPSGELSDSLSDTEIFPMIPLQNA